MDVLSLVDSMVPATQAAVYSCNMTNLWTSARHPIQYPFPEGPEGIMAHWTVPVLATHSEDYVMWAPGVLSTRGVERVAEAGITIDLRNEILDQQDLGNAGPFVRGSDSDTLNRDDTGQDFDDLMVMPGMSLLSSITMVAPSPDWFTGLYNFDMVNQNTGTYYDSFSVETYPWSSGTELGDEYRIRNEDRDPPIPVYQLSESTPPATTNGVLLDPSGSTVLPVMRWQCALQPSVIETALPTTPPTGAPVGSMNPMVPPPSACQGIALFQLCVEDDDCCSQRCVNNRCRSAPTSAAKGIGGGRISVREGAGGAAARPRSSGGQNRSLLRGKVQQKHTSDLP